MDDANDPEPAEDISEEEEEIDSQDGTDKEDEDDDQANESEDGEEDGDDGQNAEDDDGSESGSEVEEEENPPSNDSDSDNCERDKCCICLHKLKDQEIGVPTVCEHRFCCECITEWHKNSQTCPIDRQTFNSISVLRDDGTFLRMKELRDPEDTYLELPLLPDDITQCEVCGLGDREDRLLLCDECNLGYHLECLNPPLQAVPLDDWFCPSCTEDHLVHPRRRRVSAPPEIILPPAEPDSIQRSLLTRRIRQRRKKSRRTVRRKITRRKRKTTTKGKAKKSRPKARTTKGKAGTRRRKGRKIRRKGKRKVRVPVQEKPTTPRDRLASQLGIMPPKPGQIYLGLPTCKSASQASTSAAALHSLNHHKLKAGISALRLFSHYEDLADCLENESDDEQLLGEGSLGIIRPARHRFARLPSKIGMTDSGIGIMNQTSSPDILSQIMSSQQTLLMDRNIRIGRDGVLIPSVDTAVQRDTFSPSKLPSVTKTGGGDGQESTNRRIRQAPLNNSEQSSNSSQNSRYNNDSSAHLIRSADPNSTTESETLIGSVSNSHGRENNDEVNESMRYESTNQCDLSPQKSKLNKARSEEKNKLSNEDDEDFNIYSDIQENNVTDAIDPVANFSNQIELYSGEIQNESDNEMIIDEAVSRRRSSDDKATNNQGNENMNADDFVRFPPTSDSDNSPSPGMPEADSPESIPLPDSTPPPSVPMPDEPDADEVNEIQGGSVLYSPSDDEESGRQVYDPSQPLTSSDEEEHNDRRKQSVKQPPAPKEPANKNSQARDSNVNIPKVDVDSIPVPAPSDEQKRPTIQFSIPTRHKLIPISSLIKRQRGVTRKESSGLPSNQTDTSKLFGETSQNDTTDGDTASQSGTDKPSLVAEIFGSDDEEEGKDTPVEESVAQESMPSEAVETSTADRVTSLAESLQSNKWKRVDETPAPTFLVQGSAMGTIIPVANEGGSAGLIEPDREAATNEMSSANIKHDEANAKRPAALETVSDGSDDDIKIISTTRKEPDIIFLSSEKSSSNSKDSSGKEGTREKKKDSDRRSRKEKYERHRSQKRKRSSSLSNYEEGEIPALDKKKKKVKKNKKLKKRKRSKDSNSPSRPTSNDKQPDVDQNFNSSSDADEGRNVSWRKPSKSAKERNYRDGKPKTDEKYFREKDVMEGSSHDRKDAQEKSPHYRSKDRRGSKSDGKKSHRRSTSREKVSPIRWSRSPSPTRNRARGRRERNRSRSISSRESFSPRRSAHSRRHPGYPLPIRNERSGSKSPRLRSRSPTSDKYRRSRRSHSKHRSRSNHRRDGRVGSSSGSRSRSRSRTKRRHDKLEGGEKFKKASSKKDKEKILKETSDDLPPDEETKDKEKKKRRKRKEKSISPAKAVFADGDSIVISLNFQKPKEAPKESTESNETTANEESTEKKKKKSSGRDGSSTGKSKPLKKTVLIDLETSPIQEQKIGESPTLVVLSDDEEEHSKSKHSRRGKESHHNDKEQEGVTTSGGGEDSSSPNFPNGKGVQADSTQANQTETPKPKDFMFAHDDDASSPARGDSIVTSTRDSIEGTGQIEEDSGSRSNSPTPLEAQPMKHDSPRVKTPPVAESPVGKQIEVSRNESFRSTPTSAASMAPTINASSVPASNVSNSTPGLARPLGIGNIPGLFPSSAIVSGIPVPPTPVVIPTPPQPQLRFATNAMNPSINILASVANALYGPLMAARQVQPVHSKPMPTANNVGQRVPNQPNIILPKNQNSHSHGRRSGDGGDSPFSPNSSDGDDLFEPPLEKRMSHNLKDSQSGPSCNSIGHKPEKNDRPTALNPPTIGSAASALNAKSKSALFDSLFGSPSKKTPTQSSCVQKTHVKVKAKPHEASKSKVHKPEIHKQLTEGELRETGEVPSSAVELRVKEKYLKKLNRQERVVEEVKLALKPHYGKKIINKDDYKEILRRAVPKICHTKSGEINPFKIKELVEAYVKKFRHSKGK